MNGLKRRLALTVLGLFIAGTAQVSQADSFGIVQSLNEYASKLEAITQLTMEFVRVDERPAYEGDELERIAVLEAQKDSLILEHNHPHFTDDQHTERLERLIAVNHAHYSEPQILLSGLRLTITPQRESWNHYDLDSDDMKIEIHQEAETVYLTEHVTHPLQAAERVALESPPITGYEDNARFSWFPFNWCRYVYSRMSEDPFEINAADEGLSLITLTGSYPPDHCVLAVQKIEGEWIPVEMRMTDTHLGFTQVIRYADHVRIAGILVPSTVTHERHYATLDMNSAGRDGFTVSYFLTDWAE